MIGTFVAYHQPEKQGADDIEYGQQVDADEGM